MALYYFAHKFHFNCSMTVIIIIIIINSSNSLLQIIIFTPGFCGLKSDKWYHTIKQPVKITVQRFQDAFQNLTKRKSMAQPNRFENPNYLLPLIQDYLAVL